MSYYVYRFLNSNNEVIYVGKTNDLDRRMKQQHFTNAGNLTMEEYGEVNEVEYITLKTRIDMDIKELYYINTWKPKFNRKDKIEESIALELAVADEWLKYDESTTVDKTKSNYVNKLEKENKELKEKIRRLEDLLKIKNPKSIYSHIVTNDEYKPSMVCDMLNIKSVSLKKYSLILESNGYQIKRNHKNFRVYCDYDINVLKIMLYINKHENFTLDDIASKIVKKEINIDDFLQLVS